MSDANLLKALNSQGKGGCLENIVIYGRIRCAIDKPKILGTKLQTVPKGAFAIIDAYALRCMEVDYFKEPGYSNSVYFTKGSMLIYIDDEKWVGKDVKVYGVNSRRGVKIRQQWNHATPVDGITAFVFLRQGDSYVIAPNHLVELGEHDSDIKMTPLEDFVIKLKAQKDGVIEYPITLDSILEYEAVTEYSQLDHVEGSSIEFIDNSDRVDVSKIDLHLTYHLEAKEPSSVEEDVKEDIEEMSKRRRDYKKQLGIDIADMSRNSNDPGALEAARSIRKSFISNIAYHIAENVGNSAIKGRYYLDEFLGGLMSKPIGAEREDLEDLNMKAIKASVERFSAAVIADPSILYGSHIEGDDEESEIPMLADDRQFSLLVISLSTGIDIDKLRSTYNLCHRNMAMDFSCWFYTLINYPYALGLIGSLSVTECDILYLSYTKCFSDGVAVKENKETRLNLIYLQTLEHCSDKDTLVKIPTLCRQNAYYSSKGKTFLEKNNFPIKKDLLELLEVLCGCKLALTSAGVEQLKNMKWYSKERTEELTEMGVINSVDDMLMLETDFEKEFLIYSVLRKKGSQLSGITDKQVEDTIETFEANCGFKLEVLQKDGIKLCKYKAGVLSGCAGSGKTTTSDCMTLCVKENLKGYTIMYGAPTGKACRRLAEVNHGTVKTIHSMFGVGLGGDSYLADIKPNYNVNSKEKCIYFFDEMAMANTSLLYEVVRNLGEDDIIYFLGDIKQLPPIGKGNPFSVLMRLLPCVELGVSKRAAEGSEVNYNTTLINCMSDDVVRELSYDEKTFFCRECLDIEIPSVVTRLWRGFMDGTLTGTKYNEDDIQVISGYAKPDYLFSSTALNPPLQQMLRAKNRLLFRHQNRDFYEKDRVIHVNVNCYGTQRYTQVAEGVFKAVVTLGMVNGEMGTLVGILRSDSCSLLSFREEDLSDPFYNNLSDEEKEKLLKAREEREDIRDDSEIKDPKTYFAVVKVYDVDLAKDVYVFYTARSHYEEDTLVFTGADWSNVELAYALTTHKMQGSQSPVVILPFGSSCNSSFINRNMINTMVTRSQGIVAMVGTVKGADSPVTQGRMQVSKTDTNDLLTILSTT